MNRPRRHIHLGARLETAEKVRRGETTARDAAAALGVDEDEVLRWVASGERPLSFDDVLASPEARRLTRRAQRLVGLISEADEAIRSLTQMLARGRGTQPHGAE